ncbi:MAG: hypothetical protein U1F98_18155 [Verrucomicrobiota bacterium]
MSRRPGTSPAAGLSVSNLRPDSAERNWPSINSRCLSLALRSSMASSKL